jgi:hypothetical protein
MKLKDLCQYLNFRLMDDRKKVLSEKVKVWVPELQQSNYKKTMEFTINNETKTKISKRLLQIRFKSKAMKMLTKTK